jgi:hypothetical protein
MSLSRGFGFRLLGVFSDSCTQFFAELGILNITLLVKGGYHLGSGMLYHLYRLT